MEPVRNDVVERAERRKLRLLLELDELDEFLRVARRLEAEHESGALYRVHDDGEDPDADLPALDNVHYLKGRPVGG